MPSTPQRKMVGIDVVETSGVDHPAHLQEGWLVCKSATGQDITSLFGSTTEGSTMPTTDASQPATKATGPTVEELQKEIADLKKQLADKAKANPFGKAADEETDEAEMLKSLPAPVRAMLEKSARETEELRKAAAADRENFEKERDARLDQAAVAQFEGTYKSIALDASTVAPALRRVETINPELAKAVTTALAAADEQLKTAGLFTEVGKSAEQAGGATALERINQAASEIRKSESGKDLTEAAAFAKAVQDEPELYREYLAEMGK